MRFYWIIVDFGLARVAATNDLQTDGDVHLKYLLNWEGYDEKVDICTPDLATLDEVCEPYAKYYIHKLPPRQKQNYKKLVGYKYETGSRTLVYGVSLQGIALLDQLLSFDHRTRLTAEEALGKNIYIKAFYINNK
ncbi:unnamed protein product [Rotaria sp. Silwood2]|nr:unnamed protein product [Rotaria sp. Silwood2]